MSLLMTTDAVGGLWTYALDLGRELARKSIRVKLAVLGPGLDDAKRTAAARAGLALMELEAEPARAAGAAEVAQIGEALASEAHRNGVDLVHLNHPALAAQVRFDAPVLGACHSCLASWWEAVRGTPLPNGLTWQVDLVGQGYKGAQALVAPSRAFAEVTQRLYGLEQLPHIVHHGRAPEPTSGPPSPPTEAVFTAGRLWDEAKNVRTLDRVAALTTAPFRAAGSTNAPDGTPTVLTHLDTLGPLSEDAMRRAFAERPIYVSAARFEPFGLAVLEAAQAGCALVLSDIDGFRELWTDAALFVPPSDEEGFAAAIGRLLSDPDLRADYAHAAQNRARAFSLDAFADDMINLYRSLLTDRQVEDAAA